MADPSQKPFIRHGTKAVLGGMSVGSVIFGYATFQTLAQAKTDKVELRQEIRRVERTDEARRLELKQDLKWALDQLGMELRERNE